MPPALFYVPPALCHIPTGGRRAEPAPLRVMADDVRSAHPGRCVARFGRAPRTELHPDPQGRSFPFAPEHMDLVRLTLTLTLTLTLNKS